MDTFFRLGTSLFAQAGEHGEAAAHGAETAAAHHGPSYWGLMFYTAVTIAIMFIMMAWAKQGLTNRTFKNPAAWLLEHLYFFIENLVVGIIGPHGRKYIPMMMVFWMVIFVSNLVSLYAPTAPTADLSFNLALALIAVGYVQWEGMKANGPLGHFAHFAGPKLPLPMIFISVMIFLIEILSEVMKNVSLSLRLYGNIHGGHQAVEAMNKLGGDWVPVGAFLLPIKLLTCLVQALIFTLLTSVYISLVTHHEEHGHDHGEAAAAH